MSTETFQRHFSPGRNVLSYHGLWRYSPDQGTGSSGSKNCSWLAVEYKISSLSNIMESPGAPPETVINSRCMVAVFQISGSW